MSILGSDRRRWLSRGLIYCLVLIGFTTIFVIHLTASEMMAVTTATTPDAISALEESIALLKWVGGGIVSGLVTAVALLYRALEKANAQLRADLLSGLNSREELMKQSIEAGVKNLEAVQRLTEKVDETNTEMRDLVKKASQPCPMLRKSEEG